MLICETVLYAGRLKHLEFQRRQMARIKEAVAATRRLADEITAIQRRIIAVFEA